jgi:hypothetical protein
MTMHQLIFIRQLCLKLFQTFLFLYLIVKHKIVRKQYHVWPPIMRRSRWSSKFNPETREQLVAVAVAALHSPFVTERSVLHIQKDVVKKKQP